MPKLTGIFEQYLKLDKIEAENIISRLPFPLESHYIENFIGNKILYPQSIPMNYQEMEIEFVLLEELIRQNSHLFYNHNKNKLVIPEEFGNRFYPLERVILTFLKAIALGELTKLVMKDRAGEKALGSIITVPGPKDREVESFFLDNKEYQVQKGQPKIVECSKRSCELKLNSGKSFQVYGGEIGLVLDVKA